MILPERGNELTALSDCFDRIFLVVGYMVRVQERFEILFAPRGARPNGALKSLHPVRCATSFATAVLARKDPCASGQLRTLGSPDA